MPLLVISEILGLFINTLTADVQYFLPNTEYLLEPIKIQLSKEKSFFSQFSVVFVKFASNFKQFEKRR